MSNKTAKNIFLVLIFVLASFFTFGCDKPVPVNDIYFKVEGDQEQIVLLVGQVVEAQQFVYVQPNYASNKDFKIESMDESIISISSKTLVAQKEGSTFIKVISNDNESKQDIIAVSVKSSVSKLEAPKNFAFNSDTQTISFDAVTNASSYTINIDNVEMDLGNTTSFSLSDYKFEKFNKLLNVKVKANAPKYSYVFRDSSYSGSMKIYQSESAQNAEIKGGILKFNKTNNSNADIYINGNLASTITESEVRYDLNTLSSEFAGTNMEVKVVLSVKTSVKQELGYEVVYYDSRPVYFNVAVLDAPTPLLNSSVLTWNHIPNVKEYDVFVNNIKVSQTTNNYIDLLTCVDLQSLLEANSLKVVAVNPENSINLAQTTKVNSILFAQLNEPVITLTSQGVCWNDVENAEVYSVEIIGEDTNIKTTTTETSISFANYEHGDYTIKVSALSNMVNNVTYLSSNIASKIFTKKSTTNSYIEDYTLNIETVAGEEYYVEVHVTDDYSYATTLSATSTNTTLDLISADVLDGNNYSVGGHSIKIIRKGDNSTSIDSDEYSESFIQLEEINNISISNGKVSVIRSDINANAKIILKTTGGSLPEPKTTESLSITFSSTDEDHSNFLQAGNYTTKVYVVGDGSSTFSCNYSDSYATHEINFEVLAAPTLVLGNSAEEKLIFNEIENAESYKIYENNNSYTTSEEYYEFGLSSGSAKFKVQALGNNSTKMDSIVSDEITVTRLNNPEMVFNNTTNVLSLKPYDTAIVVGYNVQVKNQTYSNYTDIPFEFGTEFTAINVGENNVKVRLNAKLNNGSTYYLNSNEVVKTLTKLSEDTEFSVVNNMLQVKSVNPNKYNLELSFNFSGTIKKFVTDGNNLVCETYSLPCNYDFDTNTRESIYRINLLNEQFNAIVPEFKNGFTVSVKYVQPSTGDDSIVNSHASDVSETLNLQNIDKETQISINANNQLEITPASHSKEYYLNVKINVASTDYVFTSNSSKNKLIYSNFELPYSYNADKYIVNLLNEQFEPYFNSLTSNFVVTVQYLNVDGDASDVDSEYSDAQSVELLLAATLQRVEGTQNLQFNNIKSTYTSGNYAIIVNGSEKIELGEGYNVVDGKFTIPFEDIYSRINHAVDGKVYTLAVLTKNTATSEASPLLSRKGETISVKRETAVTLTSSKNNDSENNSTIVSFNTNVVNYNNTYILKIFNSTSEEEKQYSVSASPISQSINFALDEISLEGTLSLKVLVNTTGKDGEVYVFNSTESNTLSFVKILAPTDISVEGNKLCFTAVENAAYYELYKVTGTSYVKVFSNPIDNNYPITNWLTDKLVIKSISNVGGYTNSSYSEEFYLSKLENPKVSVENGIFKIDATKLNDLYENASMLKLLVNNGGKNLEFDLLDLATAEGLSKSGNYIYLQPSAILNYGVDAILEENIKFTYSVSYYDEASNKFYLNSEQASIIAKGLFAPTELKKSNDGSNLKVEFLSWKNNDKNQSINVKYQFVLVYEEKTYSSNDVKLKYLQSGSYHFYPSDLTDTQVNFPYGYDSNDDGDFEDEGDIIFKDGSYGFKVKALPNATSSGDNVCVSKYSALSTFTIMSAPELYIENGVLVWKENTNATSYDVDIYTKSLLSSTYKATKNVTTSYYDFSDFTDSGLFEIKVRAISSRTDTLNSLESKSVVVHRLPKISPEKVYIDDGYLIMEASNYFHYAIITVKDNFGNKTTKYFVNESLAENLKNLSSLSFAETTKYCVDIDKLFEITSECTYTISIQLIGTDDFKLPVLGTTYRVGIINSEISDIDGLTIIKYNPIATQVAAGVLNFKPYSSHATISGTTFTLASGVNPNYNLTNGTVDKFWNKTLVYSVNVQTADAQHQFYVVDYYSYITNKHLLNDANHATYDNKNDLYAYVKQGNIYFNVYINNTINLRDFETLYYHPTIQSEFDSDDGFAYTSNESTSYIDLVAGGSFAINIKMVGGDSCNTTNVGCVTSNEADLMTFTRYGAVVHSTEDGKISFADARQGEDDTPIYELTFKERNSGSAPTIWYAYYSEVMDIDTAKTIASRSNALYNTAVYIPLSFSETYENQVNIDFGKYVDSGTYEIVIRVLAGVGDNTTSAIDYLINSNASLTQAFHKFSDVKFSISNGLLTLLELSYVEGDNNSKVYTKSYELIVIDKKGNEYIVEIDEGSDGVTIENNKLLYNLPQNIAGLSILSNDNYNIKVRAKTSLPYYLNGTYALADDGVNDYVFTFQKLGKATNVKVQNGELTWVAKNFSKVNVAVVVGSNKVLEFEAEGTPVYQGETYLYHTVKIKDGAYDYITGNVYITAGTSYKISVQLIGSDTNINSDFTDNITVERLSSVDSNSIVSNNGTLSWDAITNAVEYYVNINGYEYTTTTNKLNTSMKDNNNNLLPAGEDYTISITAIGNNYITAVPTEVESFSKINGVTTINIEGDKIKWNAVEGANLYYVTFEYNGKIEVYETDQTEYVVPGDLTGTFVVTIQAVVSGESSILGSNYLSYETSLARPNSVTDLKYDSENFKFTWKGSDDLLTTDQFKITYSWTLVANGPYTIFEETIDVSQLQDEYSYQLSTIGNYSNFTVEVVRNSTPNSLPVNHDNTEAFTIYASGNGEKENPYIITELDHLLNISKFATAKKHFKLGANIDMSGCEFDTSYLLAEEFYSLYLLAEEFNGTLDGDGRSLQNFATTNNGTQTINLSNVTEFALFGALNNATIKNLNIGSAEIVTNFVNTFDSTVKDVINLSMIATGVKNSTLENVHVLNVNFEVGISSQGKINSEDINIAGFATSSEGTTYTNCSVNLSVNINTLIDDELTSTYVGGMVALSNKDEFTNSDEVNISSVTVNYANDDGAISGFGGIAAYVNGSSINNVKVNIELEDLKSRLVGGIAAYASSATIENCVVTGKIAYGLNSFTSYIGGIVGQATNSSLLLNSSDANITIDSNASYACYFGGVVGDISGTSTIKTSQSNYIEDVTDRLDDGSYVLGIYGNKYGNITIERVTT